MGKVILKLDNVSYRYDDAEADDYVLKDINYSFGEHSKINVNIF